MQQTQIGITSHNFLKLSYLFFTESSFDNEASDDREVNFGKVKTYFWH